MPIRYFYEGKIQLEGQEHLVRIKSHGADEWSLLLDGNPIDNTISLTRRNTIILSDGTKLELERNNSTGRWRVWHEGVSIPRLGDEPERCFRRARRVLGFFGAVATIGSLVVFYLWQDHFELDRATGDDSPLTTVLLTLAVLVGIPGVIWLFCAFFSPQSPRVSFGVATAASLVVIVLALFGLVTALQLISKADPFATPTQRAIESSAVFSSFVRFLFGFVFGIVVGMPSFKAFRVSGATA